MCIRVLEIVALQNANVIISWFPHRISMRYFPEVAIPQITADHLPKYNLGFFFISRRNKNRIWHFTSSELRMNKNKKINVTSIKFSVSVSIYVRVYVSNFWQRNLCVLLTNHFDLI
jgi:hypothetical protein